MRPEISTHFTVATTMGASKDTETGNKPITEKRFLTLKIAVDIRKRSQKAVVCLKKFLA